MQDWNKMAATLNKLPFYDCYIKERFLCCLDLYLCLRGTRMRVTVQPEDLIPRLLSSKDLQRAELELSRSHEHHSDDKCGTARRINRDRLGRPNRKGLGNIDGALGQVRTLAWCPNAKLSLICDFERPAHAVDELEGER
jgi:ribosome biogenesis protein ERB1